MSFRVDPRGQGSRERHDLWVEFPISGLKTQAVSPPSHPGTVGPVLSNSLSVFLQMWKKILPVLPAAPGTCDVSEKGSFAFKTVS